MKKRKIFKQTFSWRETTCEEVLSVIINMKNLHTKEIYDMSNNFLKKVINVILLSLTYIIKLFLNERVFPDQLKVAKVCPVFKKGQRCNPGSYRLISIIPVFFLNL